MPWPTGTSWKDPVLIGGWYGFHAWVYRNTPIFSTWASSTVGKSGRECRLKAYVMLYDPRPFALACKFVITYPYFRFTLFVNKRRVNNKSPCREFLFILPLQLILYHVDTSRNKETEWLHGVFRLTTESERNRIMPQTSRSQLRNLVENVRFRQEGGGDSIVFQTDFWFDVAWQCDVT